jgi:hypothetical protein
VCVCVCVCVIYIYIYISSPYYHTYSPVCMHACSIYGYVFIHAMYACMYVYTYVCMYTDRYMYTCPQISNVPMSQIKVLTDCRCSVNDSASGEALCRACVCMYVIMSCVQHR